LQQCTSVYIIFSLSQIQLVVTCDMLSVYHGHSQHSYHLSLLHFITSGSMHTGMLSRNSFTTAYILQTTLRECWIIVLNSSLSSIFLLSFINFLLAAFGGLNWLCLECRNYTTTNSSIQI